MPIHKTNMAGVRERRNVLLRMKEEREANSVIADIESGENYYRFLPPWSAAGEWRKEAWFHNLFKAEMKVSGKKVVVCLKRTYDQACALCEQVDQMFKMKDPEAEELAKEIRAKQRFFSNVLDLTKKDGKVYVLPFGQKLEERIVGIMEGGKGPDGMESFGVGDITDVQTGRNMMITKKVNPKNTKETDYAAQASPQPSVLPNAEAFCSALNNLDEFVMRDCVTYDQMKAALNGTEQAPSPAPAPSSAPAAAGFPLPASPAPSPLTAEFMPVPGAGAPPAAAPAPSPAPAPAPVASEFGPPPGTAPASQPPGGKPAGALARLQAMNAQKAAK